MSYDRYSITASYEAGRSFGLLLYRNDLVYNVERFINELNPCFPLIKESYIVGLRDGLENTKSRKSALGICDPRENDMPVFETPKRDSRTAHWFSARFLNYFLVAFDIIHVNVGKDKLYLELCNLRGLPTQEQVDEEDSNEPDPKKQWKTQVEVDHETEKIMMSLGLGGRDSDMRLIQEHIKNHGIVYNLYIEKQDYGNGQSYYDVTNLPEESSYYQKHKSSNGSNGQPAVKRIPGMPDIPVSPSRDDFDPFLDSDDLP